VAVRTVIVVATASVLASSPVQAQGLFGLLQQSGQGASGQSSGVLSYAPAETPAAVAPLNILPINPNAGAVGRGARRGKVMPPSPAVMPAEIDEDADLLVDHDEPKRVTVQLPPPRPGATPVAAAEVAPVGQARMPVADQLPPGVGVPGLPSAGQHQSITSAPRLASLPSTGSTPRWTLTDEAPLRPPGSRESEQPVADMPGVWAPSDATFQCLPDSLKQALVDVARRFGHVAILNAQRGYGTGARGSYHYRCRAVDFRVRGQPVMAVYNFLRDHPNVGGRKIYPMGFFHIDDGPARSW
jgi:hypothetical protein